MKTKITSLFISFIATFGFYSCDTDVENMEIQKLKTYDEQYFQNLRDFKKSDHEISYAYYEGWSPIEGVTGYKDPASWGERMVGLPDSIDIVNLWMGIPTAETHPIATFPDNTSSHCLSGHEVLSGKVGHSLCYARRCFQLSASVYG